MKIRSWILAGLCSLALGAAPALAATGGGNVYKTKPVNNHSSETIKPAGTSQTHAATHNKMGSQKVASQQTGTHKPTSKQ